MAGPQQKQCPYCAEDIRAEAILCKHCRMPLTQEATEALRQAQESAGQLAQARSPGDKALEQLSKFVPQRVLEGILAGVDDIEEGERRTVTVLFADLVGFTQLSETIDQEELANLVDETYRLMADCVRRYDGIVDKFVGDAVMAIFGAPVAHEDDPERAVRAAMDLRTSIQALGKRLEVPLTIRAGINSGEVIVKIFGADRRADYTAIGDAVNLASRLEGEAQDGDIVVSERVAKRVRLIFGLEAIAPLRLKGIRQPVRAHRVVRELKPFSKASLGERIAMTEFVGREFELQTLTTLMGRAETGRGQVVVLRGEAGVGKSRLIYEFYHSLEAERVSWYTGRCTSYGVSVPYQPLAELMRRVIGIEEEDDPDARRKRLRAFVGHLPPTRRSNLGAPLKTTVRASLEILLGVDEPSNPLHALEPRDRRERIFESLRWALQCVARRRPLVLVFEDIHWADPLSLEFLDSLILGISDAPIMVMLVSRPTITHHFPEITGFTQITLDELSDDQSALLLKHLLRIRRMTPEVETFILERTRGNPFFVEEMALALQEQGILEARDGLLRPAKPLAEAQVPDTLEGLILSRIDRLEKDLRRVIQCASVIGQEFRERVLRHVTELAEKLQGAVTSLMTMDLIVEKSSLPELEYLFRHAVTREVAYHTLLSKRRARFHHRVAEAILEVYGDRQDEYRELIAHHLFNGGAGEEARVHLKLAAEKCRLLDANLAAVEFTEHLIEVLEKRLGGGPELAEETGEAKIDLGRLLYLTGDYAGAEARYREAFEHAESHRFRRQRLVALRNLGPVLWLMGRPKEGIHSLRRALRVCPPDDAQTRAGCHLNLGVILMGTGKLAKAKDELEHFFRWARKSATAPSERYVASANHGLICHALGDLSAAEKSLDRAISLAEEMGRRREHAEALLNRARLDIDRGRLREAQQRLNRALRTALAMDHARLSHSARLALAEVAHHRGVLAAAVAQTRRLMELAETEGQTYLAVVTHLNLAQIHLAQNLPDESLRVLREGEALAKRHGDESLSAPCHATAAQAHVALGQVEEARDRIRAALELTRAGRGNVDNSLVQRAAGEVALAEGDLARARRHMEKAKSIATDAGLRRELALAITLGVEIESRGANGKGKAMLRRARKLAEEVGDGVLLRRLKTLA